MSATAVAKPQPRADEQAPARVVRLGAVSYLNAEPTVYGLEREPGFRVERDLPARVAERLHAGEVDLGLVPSIEYAFGRYAIVPGVAIASRGPVRSVRLFHRGPEGVRPSTPRAGPAPAWRVLLHARPRPSTCRWRPASTACWPRPMRRS